MPIAKPSIPVEIAREFVRQEEVNLTALLTIALAADTRANTYCGIFGTAALTIGAAVSANTIAERPFYELTGPGVVVALGLLASAVICAFAGAPRDFRIPGANAALRDWSWDGSQWRSEDEILDATIIRYGESIEADRTALAEGGRRLSAALLIALSSFILGAMYFYLISRP
jgi:hypothetical protein